MNNYIFSGFSTSHPSNSRSWALYDIDLIKCDLTNHFHTRIGERRMRPTFGCSIWDKFMEPMSPSLKEDIEEEVIRIISLDTRVSIKKISMFSRESGLTILVDLFYRPFDIVDQFRIEFENRQ